MVKIEIILNVLTVPAVLLFNEFIPDISDTLEDWLELSPSIAI